MDNLERKVPILETPFRLRDLRTFCRVVDEGSITAAARVLGETKGSVSRRIARLEEDLGTALIQRVGGRARPTAEGLAYRKRAGEAVELLDAAAAELRDLDAAPRGHLRVTALPGMGASLLAEPVGRFLERYPGVSVEMLLTEDVLSFRDDRIDFAFRTPIGQLPDSGHIAHVLGQISPWLAASPEYLATHGAPTHPRELANHRLLVPPARAGGFPLRVQPRGRPEEVEELELQGHLLSHDARFLQEAALAGGGITLIMPVDTDSQISAEGLVPVLPDWELAAHGKLYLVHPSGPLSPKARAFRDFMKQWFRRGSERREVAR